MNVESIKHNLIKQLNTPFLAVFIIILLCLGMISTVWQTVQNIRNLSANDMSDNFRQQPSINVRVLSSEHILGNYNTNVGDLPLASLGVTLIAVFADANNTSSALIMTGNGGSKFYHLGDKLAANVVIEKILPYSVIVDHNGRLEKLTLPIHPLKFNSSATNNNLWSS